MLPADACGFVMEDFSGYSLSWSPFLANRIVVAASQYYGIVGNGRLYVLDVTEDGSTVLEMRHYETMDGSYDVAWSEENENQFVSCSGDGSVKLYDVALPEPRPIMSYLEHTAEVYSVDWDLLGKERFLSSSWDHSVRLWDPAREQALSVFMEHEYCVYEARWSPRLPRTFASASGDCAVKMWDAAAPGSVATWRAHDFEVLSCDWNKYNPHELVTASVDKSLRFWDVRKLDTFVSALHGHKYAVRRVRYSPHSAHVLASASYDMRVLVWDVLRGDDALVADLAHHTEFAVGLEWCLFNDRLASTGWDSKLSVWTL